MLGHGIFFHQAAQSAFQAWRKMWCKVPEQTWGRQQSQRIRNGVNNKHHGEIQNIGQAHATLAIKCLLSAPALFCSHLCCLQSKQSDVSIFFKFKDTESLSALLTSSEWENKPAWALTASLLTSVMQNILLQMHILLGVPSIHPDKK